MTCSRLRSGHMTLEKGLLFIGQTTWPFCPLLPGNGSRCLVLFEQCIKSLPTYRNAFSVQFSFIRGTFNPLSARIDTRFRVSIVKRGIYVKGRGAAII